MSAPARFVQDSIMDLAERASEATATGANLGFIQSEEETLFAVGLLVSAATSLAFLGGMAPEQVAAFYRQCAEETISGEAERGGEKLSEMAGTPS